jgi:glycosyltransferase involved in cell wall biosynthesis
MGEHLKGSVKPGLLVIGPTPPPYHGVSISIAALLGSSIGERFEVHHVDLADRRGIEHVDKPDLHDVVLFIGQWLETCRVLVAKRPRLVYLPISQNTIGFLRDSFFMVAALAAGARVVIHLHGANLLTWYSALPSVLRNYAGALLRRCSCGIVLGESLRHNLEEFLPPEKVVVVPNGIDAPEDSAGERRARDVENGSPPRYRILHLSTLMRQKGALVFIEAIPRVVEKRQDVEFILAGPWANAEDRKQAEAFMRKTAIEAFVRFTGPVYGTGKFELFRSCDLFVFPGIQQEGQPLVVLEAMSSGLPVLFTDRGCLRETVVEGKTGLETRTGDPEDLARKILSMVDCPARMKQMGAAGRRRFEGKYTVETHMKRLMEALFLTLSATGCRSFRSSYKQEADA